MIINKSTLTLTAGLALALTGCTMVPGSHIPTDVPNGLYENANTEYVSEAFEEADLDKLVRRYAITPMLIAEMNATKPAVEVNTSLTAELENYDYRIGKGDVLSITVWNHPELTIPAGSNRSAEEAGNWVHNDGTIFYPYIGRVEVAGKTIPEIRKIISARLAKYIENPQVDVTIAAFRSQRVYVTGEVSNPGTLPITNVPLTLLEAINRVGGLSASADWAGVTVTRDGRDMVFSLRDLYRYGDTSQNLVLRTDDVLHVERNENSKVFVLGEVVRPQSFVMGRRGMTLAEALTEAGGFDEQSANASGIFVLRQADADSGLIADVYQLNAKNAVALIMAEQFTLQERDIVYVTAAPVARWNRVLSQLLPTVSGLYSVGRANSELTR
ncbi:MULTISPECIES: polysaccharide export protein [Idiomarinaceae]|uniref:Polysaccharide export protein n=2 Tax=Pseudidiomarina TaxID=2800384 RepID=A0AB39XCH1_9GAMM|nr:MULTISPECIES: polysaccharide export protein [Idiomarinaceae]MDT7526304.1 polysaccharide export protein [Pseudidiomarina sp. GXY010]MRJ42543.1 polysaccharide export protein Wza [Idiomarina sp. FeN1]NCU58156.1 polysaccharide export protein Wza [Idiomarina sp. FenA--70]NCU60854.1 polysaccharide export protein Wza [Idiomarina sp. FenBw--71]UUN12752.1 polysaccharide biosynthesis/export family protein [Idiomarina loihiensis]